MNTSSKIIDCLSKVKPVAAMLLLSCLLTSCATYKDKFSCQDSRGVDCTMLNQIDKVIDSGKIEEIYEDRECKGLTCKRKKRKSNDNIPKLKKDEYDPELNTNYYSGK